MVVAVNVVTTRTGNGRPIRLLYIDVDGTIGSWGGPSVRILHNDQPKRRRRSAYNFFFPAEPESIRKLVSNQSSLSRVKKCSKQIPSELRRKPSGSPAKEREEGGSGRGLSSFSSLLSNQEEEAKKDPDEEEDEDIRKEQGKHFQALPTVAAAVRQSELRPTPALQQVIPYSEPRIR